MNNLKARLQVVSASALWSLGGVFIKSISLPGLTIVFYRAIFAAFSCIFKLKLKDLKLTKLKLMAMVSSVFLVSLYVVAVKNTTAANAIILQYIFPFFVLIFGRVILKEKIERNNVISIAIAMTGITVILLGSADQKDTFGIMLAIGSGIAFAFYTIFQRALKNESPHAVVFINNAGTALMLIPFIYPSFHISGFQLILLSLMGIIQLGIPNILYAKGLKVLTAQEASLIALVEPVLNPIWVILLVGEVPSNSTIAGGCLILSALLFKFISKEPLAAK